MEPINWSYLYHMPTSKIRLGLAQWNHRLHVSYSFKRNLISITYITSPSFIHSDMVRKTGLPGTNIATQTHSSFSKTTSNLLRFPALGSLSSFIVDCCLIREFSLKQLLDSNGLHMGMDSICSSGLHAIGTQRYLTWVGWTETAKYSPCLQRACTFCHL